MNRNNTYKFMFGIVLGLIISFFAVNPALAQDKIQVMVNNQLVAFTDQQPFINKNNRTMVPVRAPMELAGATVDWNDSQKAATVKKDSVTAVFKAGSEQYTVNGTSKKMDTTAQIVNGRTCFPIRFVAEALGMQVEWNASSSTVKIAGVIEAAPGAKPMTELTPEAKARLMAYPYPVDEKGKQYNIRSKMIEIKEQGQQLGKDVLEVMMEPIRINQVLKSNQRFFSDADLSYNIDHPVGPCRIRGVLQTTNADGSITEQDIDYGFFFGTHCIQPGETPIPSHWYTEYDTIYLSAPVRVK